ncbi:hypothetical protein JCM11641_002908 [Rhodosporidiobolus odoratus]
MSAQQPRITLRPPPHRDFLTGYPGIPASDPATSAQPSGDPLFSLPVVLRPQAHLSGTVEIRSPPKGPAVRARWLSVELEKIEAVPPAPNSAHQAENGKKDGNGAKKENRFVELIGTGPNKLWEAGADGQITRTTKSVRKKGFNVFKKGDEDEDEEGFDIIPDGNYPFKIALPEGLPPTIEVDSKLNGVSYQIVASLCCKGKKGLLKGPAKPAVFVASAPILLDKADLLGWPVYQPVLPSPLPPKLPWAAPPGELTVGETREAKVAVHREDGTAGEVWMKTTRQTSAYGPGDAVQVFVQIGWGGEKPIKLTRLDFVLRETLTFRYPSPANPQYIIRAPPKVSSLFTANASVSPDPNEPSAFAVLYSHEPVAFDLTGLVPTSHTRVTIRTAKHVDVAYHLKIRAMIEGGDEISVDNWPVVISNVSARVAKGIMSDIGWVEGLCDRPGIAGDLEPSPQAPAPAQTQLPAIPPPLPIVQQNHTSLASSPTPAQPPPSASPVLDRSFVDSATEKARLLSGSYLAPPGSYHVANPSATPDTSAPPIRHQAATPPPLAAPAPVRQNSYFASPTAEEEKRLYYENATRSRDALQSSLRSNNNNEPAASPTTTDLTQRTGSGTGESMRSPTAEDEKVALHQAAILRRDQIQNGINHRESPQRSQTQGPAYVNDDAPLVAMGQLGPARSNTMMAFSGSDVSSAAPPPPPPPPPGQTSPLSAGASSVSAALLGRSLTTAENEKRRLFLEAKETARRRQEEARLELERQNRVLAEMDFEEQQNAWEARLVAEAEVEKRTEERRRLDDFEQQQRDFIAAEEERWKREEEERRARALAELDEKKRRAEEAMQAELARFEQQQRHAEQAREDEISRQLAERKAEDDMKKAKAEELRRQDEEREREENERRLALSRKAEMERQRAEDERRRREGEEARRVELALRQAEEEEARLRAEAQARWEAEELHRHEMEEHARREAEEHARREADLAAAAAAEAARRREQEEERVRHEQEVQAAAIEEAARNSQAYAHPPDPYNHPAYPSAKGNSAAHSHHLVGGIERAPSVASFAPSMSAATATADYYAQAIAQQSALSEEKAAYLRRLRDERANLASPLAGRTPSVRRASNSQPPIAPHGSNPTDQASLYGYQQQQPAYPHPPQPPAHPNYGPPSRQNTYTPASSSGPAYPDLPQAPARPPVERYVTAPQGDVGPPVPPAPPAQTSSSSSSNGYKTAAQEKEEAAARRRAEDARAAQPPIPEEDDHDLPPSYPVQGSGTTAPRSAAEEKAELQSYYAAKAAVDAQSRQAPPPPPARSNTQTYDHSNAATPAPTYQAAGAPAYPSQYAPPVPLHNNINGSNGPAYPTQYPQSGNGGGIASAPPPTTGTTQHTPRASESTHSDDMYRDPSIAAGKRVQRSASGSSAPPPSMDSNENGVWTPTGPPPPLPPQLPNGYAYQTPPLSLNGRDRQMSYADDLARQDAHRTLGDVAFGSFDINESFPEFEELSGQIAQANLRRSASQVHN